MAFWGTTNVSWVNDAVQHTDIQSLFHPPPSKTGIDMTWVISDWVVWLCAACVLISTVVAGLEIYDHATHFTYPKLQVYVIRILLMIPFYGILSLGSVLFHPLQFFLDTIRDSYEAFVLYMFFSLLVFYCGGEADLLRALRKKRYKGCHPPPLCCLPMYPLDTEFYLRCKRWVLQYAVIKPVSSLLACVFHPFGLYREADFSADNLFTYLFTLSNLSISMSLYYLVLFHIEAEKELRYARPALKFICIKSIIFFAFWQSATVSVCIGLGWMYTGEGEVREKVNSAIQDVLMCIELLPVCFMHHVAFGRQAIEEEMAAAPVYDVESQHQQSASENLDQALSLKDVVADTMATIFYRRGKLVDFVEEGTSSGGGAGSSSSRGGGIGGSVENDHTHGAGAAAGGHHAAVRGFSSRKVHMPTIDELVQFAIANERGPRADGLLHYDEAEEIELMNRATREFADNDVFGPSAAGDLMATEQAIGAVDVYGGGGAHPGGRGGTGGVGGGRRRESLNRAELEAMPSLSCVVCGRFDRELVLRKSGYKCRECVGKKNDKRIRARQREAHLDDNDGSCVICGVDGGGGAIMAVRGNKRFCVKCLVALQEEKEEGPGRGSAAPAAVARPAAPVQEGAAESSDGPKKESSTTTACSGTAAAAAMSPASPTCAPVDNGGSDGCEPPSFAAAGEVPHLKI